MARRLKKLIKEFAFQEENRYRLDLGANTRLGITVPCLHLLEDADGYYPITDDITAKTWISNPQTVKEWLGFEAVVYHTKDYDGTEITSVNFRLGDGTDEYYWDGAAWTVSTTGWSTEAQIANNISTFPATSEKIQVIINLKTTDREATPIVEAVKILYSTDVEFFEDLIQKSLVPKMREEIRPIAAFPVVLDEDSTTIDLTNDFVLEVPYNIIEIDSVYDHTADQEHTVDLFQSYDSGTKVITLSSAITSGSVAWIRFIYEPEITVTSDREYYEIGKVPMVMLSDITFQESKRLQYRASVANKDQLTAVVLDNVLQGNIRISLSTFTESARDHNRLTESVRKFFIDNVFLNSKGIDEDYRIYILEESTQTTSLAGSEKHTSEFAFIIDKVVFYLGEPQDKFIVQNFKVQGDLDMTI